MIFEKRNFIAVCKLQQIKDVYNTNCRLIRRSEKAPPAARIAVLTKVCYIENVRRGGRTHKYDIKNVVGRIEDLYEWLCRNRVKA
jgi:hypothetical protein